MEYVFKEILSQNRKITLDLYLTTDIYYNYIIGKHKT